MLNLFTIAILFSGMLCTSMAKADQSSWMDRLDDATLITRISIPGTHDSAATGERCGTAAIYCHTQTYSFTDQLSKGIRFFDIRIANKDGDLEFHHNIYDLDINFKDAINSVKEFLSAHPSEFVIFLIKQETWTGDDSLSSDEFWELVNKQMDDFPELFWVDRRVHTVAAARGKIIIMGRDESTHPQGFHVEWEDNTVHDEGHDGELKYVVEDHWSLSRVGTETKFAEIVQNLYLAGLCVNSCSNPKTLFITFLSGTAVKRAGYTPKHYADYENPHTANWLHDHPGPRPGIVAMDFGGDSEYHGDELIEEVIKQNFD